MSYSVVDASSEEVALEPGRFVLVSPDATRQVVAADEGRSYVVVGAAR